MMHNLEEEYQRFIEFGTLLDRPMRRYLVHYLQHTLDPTAPPPPEIKDDYFQYFRGALDRIFAIEKLLPICRRNERITRQVVLDTLYWMRKTFDRVRHQNPYQEEADRVTNWSITPLHVFVKRWYHLTNFLAVQYPREVLDVKFYETRFRELIQQRELADIPAAERARLELILTDLLAQWDALVQARILAYQLSKLQDELDQHTELLEAKVTEYTQLLTLITPFSDYLGWDMSRALWEETSFDVIQEYQQYLSDEQSLQELADLLGRLREAEIELEEEQFEKIIVRREWVVDPLSRSEIVGVHESDDLSNLLSSEAALLVDEATELLFLHRFAEKQLMTFRYEDRRLVHSEEQTMEVNQRIRQREKGPFIICVDTSESMLGRPEQIAKVLCLGILKMAIREKRRAYLINFSRGIQTLDLYDIADSVDALAAFLRMSFHGGTDISLPLYEAIRQLKSEDYQDADVLVISDFIMHQVNPDVLQDVRYFQQNKGAQFHSLTLSDDPNAKILAVFDTNWIYDPQQKGVVRELTRDLHQVWGR